MLCILSQIFYVSGLSLNVVLDLRMGETPEGLVQYQATSSWVTNIDNVKTYNILTC